MSLDSQQPLPPELEERLLAILDGPDRDRDAALASLRSAHPEYRATFDSWLESFAEITADAPTAQPTEFGPYRVLECLGSGSFGTVYAAQRDEPVRQLVAIKVVRRGMATTEVLARFALERSALAAMSHRSIARVFDVGETAQGQPYFVMEHVVGLPVTRHCDEHELGIDDRLELFLEICAGVQHAHQKGIVHRDLKPANILVRLDGDRHDAKILDFGLAKATRDSAVRSAGRTGDSRVLGTLEFMSPEQARGDSAAIDVRSDVYSLGVILYELLCGELPFATESLQRIGMAESLLRIQNDDFPQPSARLRAQAPRHDQVAHARGLRRPSLRRALRGDLDRIVMRALAKEPDRRYPTAHALAMDIRRHQSHEPVEAGPPSARYRIGKLLRRHRTGAAITVVVAVSVVAIALFNEFALRESRRANRDLQRSQEENRRLIGQYEQLKGVALLARVESTATAPPPPWPEHLEQLRAAVAAWRNLKAQMPALRQTLWKMEQEAEPDSDGRPRLDDDGRQFLFDGLRQVSRRFESAELARAMTRIESVDLVWAEHLEQLAARPDVRRRWDEAAEYFATAAIYSKAAGSPLTPQIGLFPLGVNEVTGLLEFYHLRSAWDGTGAPSAIEIPNRDRLGRFEMDGRTGIIFALLPGDTFQMGAQPSDPERTDHDPNARPTEGPPHPVALEPFLLARHELTFGQWNRLRFGTIREQLDRNAVRTALPVTGISWLHARRLLRRHGFELPTEAQWEYGCRGGTVTPWWTGPTPMSLSGKVSRERFPQRVDGMASNAWGLIHTHGNVAEWCLDRFAHYTVLTRPGDGLRGPSAVGDCIVRGGRLDQAHGSLRSSSRDQRAPDFTARWLGVRAARALTVR